MKTILFMGQSNAVGRNIGGLSTFSSDVTVWNSESDRTDTSNLGTAFVAASLGGNPFVNGCNNIGLQLANKLARILREPVRLILVATGSLSITSWMDSGGTPGVMYTRMVAVLAAAGVSSVDIFGWHQGESDDGASGIYTTRWNNLVSRMTSDGYISASTPIILGATSATHTNINPVLATIGAASSRMGYADIAALATDDGTHFTGESIETAGNYYIAALAQTETEFEGIAVMAAITDLGFVIRKANNELGLLTWDDILGEIIETGTWTPGMAFGGGTTGITYSSRSGEYIKIGKLVFIRGSIALLSNGSSTGGPQVTDLPFVSGPASTGQRTGINIATTSGFASLTESVIGTFDGGGASAFSLRQWTSTGNSALTEANVGDSASFSFSGCYMTA